MNTSNALKILKIQRNKKNEEKTCIDIISKLIDNVNLQWEIGSWCFPHEWFGGLIVESAICSMMNILEKHIESHIPKKINQNVIIKYFDFEWESI